MSFSNKPRCRQNIKSFVSLEVSVDGNSCTYRYVLCP
jgi:hypothetical protein